MTAIIALLNGTFDLWGKVAPALRGDPPPLGADVGPSGAVPVDPAALDAWALETAECQPPTHLYDPILEEPFDGATPQGGEDQPAFGPTVNDSTWGQFASATASEEPAASFDFDAFMAAGGVGIDELHSVDLYLANRAKTDLVITGITAVVVEREAPYAGTMVSVAGGDGVPIRYLEFDLDAEGVALTLDAECRFRVPFFDRYKLVIAPGETEVLKALVHQTGCHCHFRLEVGYLQDGVFSEQIVPAAEAAPLEVMGASTDGYQVIYRDNLEGNGFDDLRFDRFDCRTDPAACDELGF